MNRFLYNYFLNYAKTEYENGNKTNYYTWCKKLTELRNGDEFAWLKDGVTAVQRHALHSLESAYKRFFNKISLYPKFKNKYARQSIGYPKNSFMFKDGKIHLAKLKTPLKAVMSREYNGEVRQIFVHKTSTDKYFVTLLVRENIEHLDSPNDVVGIDVGIKSLAVCSTGAVYDNPKSTKKYERKLAREQRKLSRKTKGSNNYAKQRLKVAKVHEKIRNTRLDFTHKMTTELVRENRIVCVESLRVKNMVRNKKLAKHIHDANFSEISRQLEYKSMWYGKTFIKIDQWKPSSKMCSNCGSMFEGKFTLAIREWKCTSCGAEHDRDMNAATNIMLFGLDVYFGDA